MDSKPRLADDVAVAGSLAVFDEFFFATEVSKLNLKRHYTSRIMKMYLYKRFGVKKICRESSADGRMSLQRSFN